MRKSDQEPGRAGDRGTAAAGCDYRGGGNKQRNSKETLGDSGERRSNPLLPHVGDRCDVTTQLQVYPTAVKEPSSMREAGTLRSIL
jgi:hypothetical protein